MAVCFHAALLLGNWVLPNRERDVHDQSKITRRWKIPVHAGRYALQKFINLRSAWFARNEALKTP